MTLRILHPPKSKSLHSTSLLTEPDHFDPEMVLNLKDHGQIRMRPIRKDDEKGMIRFHETLSEESVYLRYFEHISLDTRTLHERLAKVCANTADSFALVAELLDTSSHPSEIEAVGRLIASDTPGVAGFALLVSDQFQDTKLPRELLKRLILIARAFGFHTLNADLLVVDHDTLNLCRSLGFVLHTIPEDGIVQVTLTL